MSKICCFNCGLPPDQINEYVSMAKECDCTPEEFVINEEGTYNSWSGFFYCTKCYIKIGMPLGVAP